MRVLVLGHSDSSGVQLGDPRQAWPVVLGDLLADQEVRVEHRVLVPLSADAVETMEAAIADMEPDVVMLHLNPYSFAIQVVGLKVRERFGRRAARWYRRVERPLDGLTSQGRFRRQVNGVARRTARRLFGVAAIATYPAVVRAYGTILDNLARNESLDVVVMGGSRLSGTLQSVTPGMADAIGRFAIEMESAATAHRFIWFDTEASVQGPGREALFLADGVHRSPAGHQRLATMLAPIVLSLMLESSPAGPPAS